MFDDQMIYASKDKRIVNLFTLGSHHRNLSVIYIVQNLFHQGKGSRSIKKTVTTWCYSRTLETNVSGANPFLFKPVRRDCKKTLWIRTN